MEARAMLVHSAFPDVSLADVTAELHRERAARASLYPKRVQDGRMTEAEAKFGRDVIDAMIADCARLVWPRQNCAETHVFSWAQRCAALKSELAFRARLYPEFIAAGRFDQAEGERRIARLTALLWVYEDGFDWRASNGARPAMAKWQDRTREEDAAMREWWQHEQAVMEARYPAAQEELLL
jgi:hypothetical protein